MTDLFILSTITQIGEPMGKTTITIMGKTYEMSYEAVRQAGRNARPESVTRYYVELEGKRFPPTQLIRLVTGASAHSSNAQRALIRLGFRVESI